MWAQSVTAPVLPLDPECPLADIPFAVVDTETTGTRAERDDRITEIAIVPVQGGIVGQGFSQLINPERPIPWFITQLTGIHDEMVQHAPTFAQCAAPVATALTGRVFVAHNAPFDWRFVSQEFARAGIQLGGDTRLCTVRLARRLVPALPRRSLDHLATHFGIRNDARHRALGDARATADVLVRLLDIASDQGIVRWIDLMRTLSPPCRRAATARPRTPPPTHG